MNLTIAILLIATLANIIGTVEVTNEGPKVRAGLQAEAMEARDTVKDGINELRGLPADEKSLPVNAPNAAPAKSKGSLLKD